MARTDFDFLFGQWRVHHDKLVDVFGPQDGPRTTFETIVTAAPILDGGGNTDETRGTMPDGTTFVGFTLRLYDPATDDWKIWWSSTTRPGLLDDPVRGRFHGEDGEFVGPATHDGSNFLARFRWIRTASPSPIWEQDFSFDGGHTWAAVNWRMTHIRTG